MVHQHTAHLRCSHGEKVRAALPVYGGALENPKISLIHQSSGLQHMVRPFYCHRVTCDPAQVRIYGFYQVIRGGPAAFADFVQPSSDLFGWSGHETSGSSLITTIRYSICAINSINEHGQNWK
jgi:hypothetical protein